MVPHLLKDSLKRGGLRCCYCKNEVVLIHQANVQLVFAGDCLHQPLEGGRRFAEPERHPVVLRWAHWDGNAVLWRSSWCTCTWLYTDVRSMAEKHWSCARDSQTARHKCTRISGRPSMIRFHGEFPAKLFKAQIQQQQKANKMKWNEIKEVDFYMTPL